jgi:hypothetical protein
VEKPFTERFFSVQAITYCEMYSLAVMDEKIGKAFSKKHSQTFKTLVADMLNGFADLA